MLKFNTSRSKKYGIRIYVFKRYRVEDDSAKSRYSYNQVGTFLLSEGYTDELKAQLTHEEVNQLEGYLAELDFAKQFHIELDDRNQFIKISLHIPKPLHDFKEQHLDNAAEAAGVWFNMPRILLENYKNAVLSTAKKVIKIRGDHSELQAQLEAAGLSLEQEREENKHKGRLILEGRVLFKALLKLEQPIMQTCRELEACAKQYGKEKRIFPSLLEQWASDKNPKEMKKWYIAIAIDVLMQHGINPTIFLPAEQIAYYWAQNHIDHYSLSEAKQTFIDTFNIQPDEHEAVNVVFEKIYKNARL